MGCCGGDDHKCGCEGETETSEDMMSFAFSMEREMFEEVNEAAKANSMAFEEFIYNCIEVGLAVTAGELALIDTDQLEETDEENDEN
jgi:hypothetical protein